MKTIQYILLLLVSTAWANPLLEKANELYRKEKYEEAITVYETILKGKQQSRKSFTFRPKRRGGTNQFAIRKSHDN